MKKHLLSILSLVFIFSTITLFARGHREPRPYHGFMLEALVLEAKETKRMVQYRFPGEWWDSSLPGYRIEIDYELVVDDQDTISISLWTGNLDEESVQSIYNNYIISPGDILYFDAFGHGNASFDVQIDGSEVILSGSSASKDYFHKKISALIKELEASKS